MCLDGVMYIFPTLPLPLPPQPDVGHGLSYTQFNYSDLAVVGTVTVSTFANVSFILSNVGVVSGAEVAQLYVGFPEAAHEPPKLLRDFTKVSLYPQSSKNVSFSLDSRSLSIWDIGSSSWQVISCTYTLFIGSSSRDIRLTGSLTVA